jgi:hypothetical protein
MRAVLVSGAVSLLVLGVGCGATPLLSAAQGSGGDAAVSGAGGTTQPGGASICDRPAGDRFRPSSLAELQQTIRGTWLLCSDVGLFDEPQAGILIGDDDTYVLLELIGGQLKPKAGLENEGHLEYYPDDSSGSASVFNAHVNFVNGMGFTITAAPPIFSDDPRLLLIYNSAVSVGGSVKGTGGVEIYTYGRATPPASGNGGNAGAPSDVQAEIKQPTAGSGCDRPKGELLPTISSIQELQSRTRGTWMLCSPVGLFSKPQAGVFVGADDSYVFLDLVNGKLVPQTGLFNKGHVEYFGPWLTFASDDGRDAIGGPPAFSDDPRQLILDPSPPPTPDESVEYIYGLVP